MKLRSKLLIAAAAAALAGSPALADHHGGKGHGRHHGHHGMGRHMDMMDADKDGVITREEARAARGARIMKADADGDGAVTVDEMVAFHEKMRKERRRHRAERHLKRLDKNNDGKVTKAEIDAMDMPMFDKIDANGDGKITKEEREAAKAKWKERHGKGHRHGHHGGGMMDEKKDGQ